MPETLKADTWMQRLSVLLALGGGFVLSFIAFGVFWAGAPWPYHFLFFFPFLFLSWFVSRASGDISFLVLVGAFPVGSFFVQARDKNDSHLMPILVVSTWVLGTLLGRYLGGRPTSAPPKAA